MNKDVNISRDAASNATPPVISYVSWVLANYSILCNTCCILLYPEIVPNFLIFQARIEILNGMYRMSRVGVPTLWSWTGRWAFCLPFKCQSSTQSVGVVGKICEDLMVSHGFPTKFAKLHSKFDLGRGAIRLWQSSGFGGLPPSKVSFEVWVLRKLCKPTKRWTSFRRSPLLTTVLERQTVAVAVRCSQTWTVRLRWIAPWLSRNGHWWKLWKLFVHSWCLDWSNTKVCPFGWRRSWCYHQDALQAEGSTWHEMAPNGRRLNWCDGLDTCLAWMLLAYQQYLIEDFISENMRIAQTYDWK